MVQNESVVKRKPKGINKTCGIVRIVISSKSLKGMVSENIMYEGLMNSVKRNISVIPANPESDPGQAPESSYFKHLKILWTPVLPE